MFVNNHKYKMADPVKWCDGWDQCASNTDNLKCTYSGHKTPIGYKYDTYCGGGSRVVVGWRVNSLINM
jgi:hypothetical protein